MLQELILEIAQKEINKNQVSDIFLGVVVGVSPIEIQLSQKLVIGEENLVLSQEVTDYYVDMTVMHSTEKTKEMINTTHSHSIEERQTSKAIVTGVDSQNKPILADEHGHAVPGVSTNLARLDFTFEHSHEYAGRKTFLVHKALKIGEKVILIKKMGGQQYFVLNRFQPL